MANKVKDIVPLSYNHYCSLVKEPVSKPVYSKICREYLKFLSTRLLLDGEVKLPERMGTLQIQGKRPKVKVEDGKIKGLSPDWRSTLDLWESDPQAKEEKKLIYHFNEDTDGVRYKYHWSKKNVLVQNKYLYSLKMCRTNKRALASQIKQGKEYKIK